MRQEGKPKASRQRLAIAAAVRNAREKCGLSARQLSAQLRQGHNHISRIETARAPVTTETLQAIALACGVKASTLMQRAERA